MSDPTIDHEVEQNNVRAVPVEKREERDPSLTGMVEDAVSKFAKPLSNERPSADDAERLRQANDAEQRQ